MNISTKSHDEKARYKRNIINIRNNFSKIKHSNHTHSKRKIIKKSHWKSFEIKKQTRNQTNEKKTPRNPQNIPRIPKRIINAFFAPLNVYRGFPQYHILLLHYNTIYYENGGTQYGARTGNNGRLSKGTSTVEQNKYRSPFRARTSIFSLLLFIIMFTYVCVCVCAILLLMASERVSFCVGAMMDF